VDAASEHAEPLIHGTPAPSRDVSLSRSPRVASRRAPRRAEALSGARFAIAVYLATRALLLLLAFVDGKLRHYGLSRELAQWDGLWYRDLAAYGYPDHVVHVQSTLGFFPLYPLAMSLVAHALIVPVIHDEILSVTLAGIVLSAVGGAIATVLVQRLAAAWWGERTARKAVALFCLFPGSVVFLMVYSEGLLVPLAAGCLLALQQRRWLLAGTLAGLATATAPDALVLVLVCAVSAALELRRRGLRNPVARRSLLAPALSLVGVGSFALFLWVWTGTPFATLIAQHDGWSERTDPLALLNLIEVLYTELTQPHFNNPTINLNLVVGLFGAIFLVVVLRLVARNRRELSVEALVWTLGISFLALTSEYTPPNPRLLITAFPAVLVLARYVHGRAFTRLLAANAGLFLGLSALTFVGATLRP
jgi:Mannosyltransferase (PIG-V)